LGSTPLQNPQIYGELCDWIDYNNTHSIQQTAFEPVQNSISQRQTQRPGQVKYSPLFRWNESDVY